MQLKIALAWRPCAYFSHNQVDGKNGHQAGASRVLALRLRVGDFAAVPCRRRCGLRLMWFVAILWLRARAWKWNPFPPRAGARFVARNFNSGFPE